MKSELLHADGTAYIAFVFDRRLDRPQVEEMARVVDSAIATHDDLRLLLDLRKTEEFAPGAFLSPQGLLASFKSIVPVRRYAVVGAPRTAELAVENFDAILPLESHAFAAEEIEQARIWITRPLDQQ